MPLTTVQAGMLDTTAQYYSFKNRIINGAMDIDQRNAGAAVTVNSGSNYTLDRYEGALESGSTGRFTVQRSTTAPAGFINSALLTVTTTATPSGTNYYIFQQKIEGLNIADFAWGTASASAVTVSFWIRGSVTGTYPFYLLNGSTNVSYVSPFTINAANTWEYKTIAIPGPTSGTWATDNSVGIFAGFGLGAPSGRQATANTWTSGGSFFITTAGAVNFISNSGATLNITGVQLEKGSTATSFDYRPYGTELALCQRYYWKNVDPGANGVVASTGDTVSRLTFYAPVTMRATPTAFASGTFNFWNGASTAASSNVVGVFPAANGDFQLDYGSLSANLGASGRAAAMYISSATCFMSASAEL